MRENFPGKGESVFSRPYHQRVTVNMRSWRKPSAAGAQRPRRNRAEIEVIETCDRAYLCDVNDGVWSWSKEQLEMIEGYELEGRNMTLFSAWEDCSDCCEENRWELLRGRGCILRSWPLKTELCGLSKQPLLLQCSRPVDGSVSTP